MNQMSRRPKIAGRIWLVTTGILLGATLVGVATSLPPERQPVTQDDAKPRSTPPPATETEQLPATTPDARQAQPPSKTVQGSYSQYEYSNHNGVEQSYSESGELVSGQDGPEWQVTERRNE